jgi:hypothetical protein
VSGTSLYVKQSGGMLSLIAELVVVQGRGKHALVYVFPSWVSILADPGLLGYGKGVAAGFRMPRRAQVACENN